MRVKRKYIVLVFPVLMMIYGVIYTTFSTHTSLTVYGVDKIETYKLTNDKSTDDFKIKKMFLSSGEVIDNPTLRDIKARGLLAFNTNEAFQKNVGFEKSMLN